jgi:hypothetical protein
MTISLSQLQEIFSLSETKIRQKRLKELGGTKNIASVLGVDINVGLILSQNDAQKRKDKYGESQLSHSACSFSGIVKSLLVFL